MLNLNINTKAVTLVWFLVLMASSVGTVYASESSTAALTKACGADVIDMDLIKNLINKGADINGGVNKASTPLTVLLLRILSDTNPIMKKSQEETRAKLNKINKSLGREVVTPSSVEERLVALEYLINAGADVNLKTDAGTPPFTSAIYSKRAMEMLIKAGADTSESEQMLVDWIERNQQSIALLKKYK